MTITDIVGEIRRGNHDLFAKKSFFDDKSDQDIRSYMIYAIVEHKSEIFWYCLEYNNQYRHDAMFYSIALDNAIEVDNRHVIQLMFSQMTDVEVYGYLDRVKNAQMHDVVAIIEDMMAERIKPRSKHSKSDALSL